MSTPASTPSGPLAGFRVVEVASMIFGPLAGQYLGDLGADVIKVEPPEGDLTRSIGPRHSPLMGSFFITSNPRCCRACSTVRMCCCIPCAVRLHESLAWIRRPYEHCVPVWSTAM